MMNDEILIVPDVHGRKFWIDPCLNWQGSIIFLGDYHDPYPFQASTKSSLKNLEKLVDFVSSNKDRCTCLYGNHEGIYCNLNCPEGGRTDYYNLNKVSDLLCKLNLQFYKIIDNIIFSHAGILPTWLEINNLTLENLQLSKDSIALSWVSPMRGGYEPCGGILFGDVREYDSQSHIPDYYQVFGHTQLESPIIKDDYACLDCRECFIMNTKTKEIKPYD